MRSVWRSDWRQCWRSERGSVTAEFALLLPVIIGVLILGLGALSLVGMQLSNTVLVADVARALSRGSGLASVTTTVQLSKPGAVLATMQGEGSYCVTLRDPVRVPLWSALIPQLEAHACVPAP